MSDVVSLGSINVDRVRYASRETIRGLADRHDWFPSAGETVMTDGVPDALATKNYRNFVGGKGANQAVAAASASADVTLLGSVGGDEREYRVLSRLADRGVTVENVATVDRETGKAYVYVDESGKSWIAVVPGANGATDERYVSRHYDRIRRADVLLLQKEIPVPTMKRVLTRLAGAETRPTVVLNPVPTRGARPLLGSSAVDVVVVNESEYEVLGEDLDRFDGTVVRTRGGDDVVVSDDARHRISPPPVDPVDTTGAGDTFCGFLAAHLAKGETVGSAARVATIAASLATESEGAQRAIPTAAAVDRFRESLVGHGD